jgi:hypothetical protein
MRGISRLSVAPWPGVEGFGRRRISGDGLDDGQHLISHQ